MEHTKKNNTPLVTVIIPTYNRSITLAYTLQSVRTQSFRDFEVLIVGDACTDESEKVVRGFRDKRFRWYNLTQNSGGQWGPNNEGIKISRGRFIAYLGHDDLWFPWHLAELVQFIQESRTDLVYSLTALLRTRGRTDIAGPPGMGTTLEKGWIPPSSWLHRRELTEEIGPWRSHSETWMGTDADFLHRAHGSKKKIEFYRDLTVIKFPSADWKLYSRTKEFPQAGYIEKLLGNPRELQREILLESAREFSKYNYPIVPFTQSVQQIGSYLRYRFMNWYGRDRWPFAMILRRRYRRSLTSRTRARGLPPSTGN